MAPRTIAVGEAEIIELDPPGEADAAAGPPVVGWWGTVRSATVVSLGRPRVRALALVAFLARGGVFALLLPISALPSPIGIGIWIGPTSVTAAGPTARFVVALVTSVAAATVVTIAAFVLAAAAEVALYRATAAPDPDEPEAGVAVAGPGDRGARATIRTALVRLALLVPVVVAIWLAIPPLVEAGYHELTFPSSVAVPLVVRIVGAAPLAVATVLLTWLAAEIIGGLATRHVALFGAGVAGAIGAAFVDAGRWPGALAASAVASGAVSVVMFVPAAVAGLAAADRAQVALAGGAGMLEAVAAAFLVTAVFAGTVVLAAGAAAWRAALWTAYVLRVAGIRPPGS